MPIYAEPGATFEATVDNAPTGLTGTIGVRVLDTPGATIITARTTAGISENPSGSGIYSVALAAPNTLGTYSVVWDTGGGAPVYTSEDLFVTDTLTVTTAPGGSPGGDAQSLGDMRQEVLDHEFSETRYPDYIDKQLNRCQTLIAEKISFRQLQDVEAYTTVNGTAAYALPGDYMRLDSVWNLDDTVPLTQLSVAEYNDLPVSSGKPTCYTVDRSNLKLYPTPDGAYTISLYHSRYPATMAADGDYPEIPSAGHNILVRYALARCFERENDTSQAAYHWGQYEKEMIYFMGSINDDADDANQPRLVRGMWDTTDGITVVRP